MNYLSVLDQKKPMPVTFMKNLQFSKLIKADGSLREFNFRKHRDPNGSILFSVDVSDPRNNRIVFKMRQDDSSWKIEQTPLPEWVITNEHVLHQMIEEELKNAS
jgi:hypothetical protein